MVHDFDAVFFFFFFVEAGTLISLRKHFQMPFEQLFFHLRYINVSL